jgi:hypothetical protein
MTHWLTDGRLNFPMGKSVLSAMKKTQKRTSMTSFFPCISKGNIMSDFVGVLTIYTWVNAPEGKRGKRLNVNKSHFCESFEMGKDLLNQWREANPNIEMHAELVITRYID